ncbi:uncharacterized protein PV07_07801 [Cladophialophora immunda]|uniref:Uncharacterized protein n=1 Tax=Cladophialophora immunda TaxID=569365 RepID=A0A0D2CWY6_9EURO|nr:uncharacterized protein PV07_07801 [Cladophialophora immunda]KIW28119.1 hypothetical protein PV07_07801 [Cladophialophora immunda]OQV00440.1 hypothetical protein CLAIMM_05935 [Cladophialophora immunda]
MTFAWISLSTRWSLTSVQAALNVIISVLGTVGVWAFSKYWWQRGSANILRHGSELPLTEFIIVSGPGDGWDLLTVLRRRVFSKGHWHLLSQLIVVVGVTLACMFAGPIAKVSLRSTQTVQKRPLGVLPTVKGDGYEANLVDENVLWNNTIQSLDLANFTLDHMLEYLPPSTSPWTYEPSQWDPTWTLTCNSTEETLLHNVSAVGNYTFRNPIDAFPAYRQTYEPAWMDSSKYRTQVDFSSWSKTQPAFIFEEVLLFILIASDPAIDDRMYTNNATMEVCFSVLHLSHFNATDLTDATLDAEDSWRFVGPVGNASYTRLECTITRKPVVADEEAIPWIWTNDTYSITFAFRTYFSNMLESAASKELPVPTPTSVDVLRMWQAYFATVNTIYAFPTPRVLSVWMDTVQLSTALLLTLVILTALIVWTSGRYSVFMLRNKDKLDKLGIPDSKIEWIIHGAKVLWASQERVGEPHQDHQEQQQQQVVVKEDDDAASSPPPMAATPLATQTDRDHLRMATFGHRYSQVCNPTADPGSPLVVVPEPSLARIHVPRSSRSAAPSTSISREISRDSARSGPASTDIQTP